MTTVRTLAELEALYDMPVPSSLTKEVDHLTELHMHYVRASPFVLVASAGPGGLDCSPRGDPAGFVQIADEHEATIDDAWFLVTMDDSRPFASVPATRHERGYGLNFADGHAEYYKLRDPQTPDAEQRVGAQNTDWQRLKQVTTVK